MYVHLSTAVAAVMAYTIGVQARLQIASSKQIKQNLDAVAILEMEINVQELQAQAEASLAAADLAQTMVEEKFDSFRVHYGMQAKNLFYNPTE